MSRRIFRRFLQRVTARLALTAILMCGGAIGHAANVTWTGGNNTWIDGAGNNANWTPADEPDPDDVAIFNTGNTVTMTSNNTVMGLTMSGGIDLDLNTFDLTVAGPVDLAGANTNLFIGGADSTLTAEDVTVAGGAVELRGGTLTLNEPGLLTAAVLTTGAAGDVVGNGTINLDGPILVATMLNNNGTLSALARPANILLAPPARTLTINGGNGSARIDLDGSGENGLVTVQRNQTLEINATLADAFNGSLQMFQNTRLDMAGAWTLGAGGDLGITNGAQVGIPGIPAGMSTIAGGALTQTGGTITLTDNDGTLQFDAPFTMSGGNFVSRGHVIFNADATIGAGANFTRPTGSSNITVEAGRILTINQPNFDLDGQLNATSFITVNAGASLVANLGDYDPDQVANSYSSTINLNNGDITVTSADPRFVMAGTLNMLSDVDGLVTTWNGEPLDIGNDSGALDAKVNVSGNRVSRFGTDVTFKSDADVNIAGGAALDFTGTARFDGVNAANSARFKGTGTVRFNGPVTVDEAITLDMAGGVVDLDGVDATGDLIDVNAALTINAESLSSFGRANGAGGVNVIQIDAGGGATGSLTVNLDNPSAEWTLNPQGVIALNSTNAPLTLLSGNAVNVNGSLTVVGTAGSAARLDIAGTVNLVTAAPNGGLLLQGGTIAGANRLEGGQINGPGELQAAGGRALAGFGTIHAPIDFDGNAELIADGGILTVNGAVEDVGTIRVKSGASLSLGTPLNTTVTDSGLVMEGGVLLGAAVTTASIDAAARSLRGFGTVNSTLLNSGFVEAVGGDLSFTDNASDWDGASNAGHLRATGGGNLQLNDNGTFAFGGSVIAVENSRVFTNGFALDFNPGSSLILTAGKYQSTSSTDIGGSVVIGAGAPSTIEVTNNFFLSFETGSTTTLNGDLELKNNNIIVDAGAQFSGLGALRVPDGSHMVADNGADIDVLLDMQGALRPGNSQGIGRVEVKDFQLSSTSELFVELTGTSLNAFDRVVATGDAIVDGFLSIDIDDVSAGVPFVPVLGNTFNIITANTVTGEFDFFDVSGMPAGLTFHLEYLSNAVQLQVVNKPSFTADFDDDGDVDVTDLAIWKGAFDLNQLGDADGDNDSDGNDFLLWQQQLGSTASGAAVRAVPEPTGVVLALLAAALLAVRRPGVKCGTP